MVILMRWWLAYIYIDGSLHLYLFFLSSNSFCNISSLKSIWTGQSQEFRINVIKPKLYSKEPHLNSKQDNVYAELNTARRWHYVRLEKSVHRQGHCVDRTTKSFSFRDLTTLHGVPYLRDFPKSEESTRMPAVDVPSDERKLQKLFQY